jgi:hypothetical protein
LGSVAERSGGHATRLASMNAGSHASVIATGDLIALEPAWRRRQSAAWSGDPAATWEWLAAGAHHLPATHPLLLLGTPDVPIAFLRLVGRGRFRIAVPLGHSAGLDRMALCPATDPVSARIATHSARSIATVWLPFMARGTIATGGQEVRRRHGEFLSVGCRDWGDYYGSQRCTTSVTAARSSVRLKSRSERTRAMTRNPVVAPIRIPRERAISAPVCHVVESKRREATARACGAVGAMPTATNKSSASARARGGGTPVASKTTRSLRPSLSMPSMEAPSERMSAAASLPSPG